MQTLVSQPANAHFTNLIGDKAYELANHLGNVLNVVKDRKLPDNGGSGTVVAFYQPDVVSYSDYLPFGMAMVNRNGNTPEYRYGFNGMESDPELKGNGNSYTTEFRQYDPRIGRWLSLDPMMAKFSGYSPYMAFDNSPIILNDPRGLAAQKGGDDKKLKQNKNGTRSADNGNGTSTYDAPGYQTVTLPNDAKVLGTLQDSDNNGKINIGSTDVQASVGDLYRFQSGGITYRANFTKTGKFTGYWDAKGNLYKESSGTSMDSGTASTESSSSASGVKTLEIAKKDADPTVYEEYGNPKTGYIYVQQADAVGWQFDVGFAFVGGFSMYTGMVQDYTGKKLYYKGNSGNIGIGLGAGTTFFIVRSNTGERFTVDQWLGNGEGWSVGAGPLSVGWGGTDGSDKYTVLSGSLATGYKIQCWWSGTRTTSW